MVTRPINHLLGLALIGLLCGAAAPPPVAAVPTKADIQYAPNAADRLDIYQAPGPGPHKFAIFLHGGWKGNHKQAAQWMAGPLNRAGYTVFSLGYRSVPETDIAGALRDIATAIGYVQHNAHALNVTPRPFAVIGHSAGAFLAALLATDSTYLRAAGVDPADLAVSVPLDGIYDTGVNVTHYPTALRQEVFGTDAADWSRFSPIDHLSSTGRSPLFCLVHETTNPRFVEQEALFEPALRQHGKPVQSLAVNYLGHGDLLRRFSEAAQPMAPFVIQCLNKAL